MHAFVSILIAAGPAVLTDPRGALEHASHLADAGRRLEAGDIAIEAHDPRRALDFIAAFVPADADQEARKLRIEVDAYVALADPSHANDRLDRLEKIEGWAMHAARQRVYLNRGVWRRRLADAGLIVYALALAWLVLVGARELLRLYKETLGFFLASIAAVLIFWWGGTIVLANLCALIALSVLALIHASAAAMRRLAPSPRWRLILLTFLILGSLGAVTTVLSRMDPGLLLSAVLG